MRNQENLRAPPCDGLPDPHRVVTLKRNLLAKVATAAGAIMASAACAEASSPRPLCDPL